MDVIKEVLSFLNNSSDIVVIMVSEGGSTGCVWVILLVLIGFVC